MSRTQDTSLKIATLVIGVGLIAFAIWFSGNVAFEPLLLTKGVVWAFGPREFAHLIGFTGCLISGWVFISAFAQEAPTFQHRVPMLLCAITFLTLLWRNEDAVELLGYGQTKSALTLLVVIGGGCGALLILRRFGARMLEPVPALVIAALAFATVSITWEVITQRFFDVYSAEPREYVQLAQVACDMAGILVGALIVVCLIRLSAKRPRIERQATNMQTFI